MTPGAIVRMVCATAVVLAVAFVMGRRRVAAEPAAPADPRLRTAQSHPMRYYVTLPEGWTRGRKWPVLLTLEGSGRAYDRNHADFVAARGDRPYIVVTPQILSNRGGNRDRGLYPPAVWAAVDRSGSAAFDTAGVAAVLREVARNYGGEERVYLTGFSSGGHLGWALVLTRPEAFRAAAMVSPNFAWRGVTKVSNAPERATLPLHVFMATREPYLKYIEPQWRTISSVLAEHGFAPAPRTVVDDSHHVPRPELVLAFMDSVRAAT